MFSRSPLPIPRYPHPIPYSPFPIPFRHLRRNAAQMTEDGEGDDGGEKEKIESRGLFEGPLEEKGERGVPGVAHEGLPPGSAARQGHLGKGDSR